MKEKLIAIIPARMGSKRLPGKNFINFFGRPIIEWVIDEVEKSNLFDKIIVSVDEGYRLGMRHAVIRSDAARKYNNTVNDVCLHVLKREQKRNREYDYICCIYPTAYAVKAGDLRRGYASLKSPVYDGTKKLPNLTFSYSYGMLNYARHNLKYSSDNGGFYWAKVSEFLKQKTLMGKRSMPCKLDMVDINTYEDYIDAMAHRLFMTGYMKKDCKCDIL